jgi:diguanylate cyclase (GGDEF)-like protein
VLPNTDLAGARVVAQSIVEAVRRLGIEHRKSPERMVSVSCGVAAVEHPTEVSAQNALIERADRALYHAKNAGKNQISYVCDEGRR